MNKSHVYRSSLVFLLLAISLMGCQDQKSDADVGMVTSDMSASEKVGSLGFRVVKGWTPQRFD